MIIVISIFLVFTIVGLIILRSVINDKRLFTLLPAGMIVGPSVYIFLLNVNSKIFHGKLGVILSTMEFILLGCYLFIKYRPTWVNLESVKHSFKIFYFCLVALIILLSTLKMTTMFPAADSSMQWAYAATFGRGNYPIKVPWQPDLNPNYHMGAYFLEGALNNLSGLQFLTIHTLFSIYLLIAGSLLTIFLFWENKYSFKNIWLILASLILFISFGVIILAYPSLSNSLSNGAISLNQIITLIPAKQEGGAPLVNLSILGLLPARSLSLGFGLLALYFLLVPFKNSKLRILSFVLLFAVTALVEESMFLPMITTLFSIFLLSFFSFIPNLNYLKSYRKTFLLIILITSIFVILQGGFVSDNIFSQKEPVFHIRNFTDAEFIGYLQALDKVNLDLSLLGSINLFLPSPILFILILLLYSYFKRKPLLGILGIFSAISFIAFATVGYKYCEACSYRLHSFGNIAAGFGIILLLFSIFKNLSLRKNLIGLFILVPILILPTLLPDLIAQYKIIKDGLKNQMRKVIFTPLSISPQNILNKWANKNLPLNTRIIVIDREFPSPSGSLNFQYHGLYTTFGPQYIHVNRQEPGTEFFDTSLTLNPTLLKQTKTEYIYIESDSPAFKQLPQSRKDELSNSNYFEVLQSIDAKDTTGEIFFRIYKVKPEFLDSTIGGKDQEEGTLVTLQRLLPKKATIYIADYGDPPKLNFWYRMAVILALKDRDIRRNLSQTDYQVIETDITYKVGLIDKEYDFYILGPNQKPLYPSTLIWSNILASAWKRN